MWKEQPEPCGKGPWGSSLYVPQKALRSAWPTGLPGGKASLVENAMFRCERLGRDVWAVFHLPAQGDKLGNICLAPVLFSFPIDTARDGLYNNSARERKSAPSRVIVQLWLGQSYIPGVSFSPS